MSLDEEMDITWRVVDVDEANGNLSVEYSLAGHPDITAGPLNLPMFSYDPVAIKAALDKSVGMVLTDFVARRARKRLGPPAGRLEAVRDLTGQVKGCCPDCIRKMLGLPVAKTRPWWSRMVPR